MGHRQDVIDAFASLIAEIRVGLLTTLNKEGALRSRPMLTATTTFDGDLWFFTEKDDAKVDEIRACPQVGISYADPHRKRYVSVSAHSEIVEDPRKKKLLWEDEYLQWFPAGQDEAVLMRVSIDDGEYWDLHDNSMFKLGRWIKGVVSGSQPDELEHEKIHLNRASQPEDE